jgi:sarcosine oxidase subunit beta
VKSEIVIAGAGVMGCSIAYHLAERGRRNIVVVDRAADFGGGSTPKATGGFRAQFDSETNVRLSLLSRAKLQEFDSGYRPYGYLFLACDESELQMLEASQKVQHAAGLHEARMITAREARELNPAIGDERVIGGTFCPNDGFIRAMKILNHYAEGARKLGVRFEFNTSVDVNEIDAPIVINALGAWSGVPVTPLRRNVLATMPTDLLPDTMPMTVWAGDWYHLRVRDGRVLLLWPDDPPIDDEAWRDEVLRLTRERVPMLRDLAIEEMWSGLYEMSPDGHALLGRVREGLFIAAGSSGHGVMHAPALGQLLAELIVDGEASMDIRALDPTRWSAAALPPL